MSTGTSCHSAVMQLAPRHQHPALCHSLCRLQPSPTYYHQQYPGCSMPRDHSNAHRVAFTDQSYQQFSPRATTFR
jgi:hypothetical protein